MGCSERELHLLGSAPGSTCVPTGATWDGLRQMPSFLALGSRESRSWTLGVEAEVDAALRGALDMRQGVSPQHRLGAACWVRCLGAAQIGYHQQQKVQPLQSMA